MRFYKTLLTLAIAFAALFGDYIVFKSRVSNFLVLKAVSDTVVHGAIGGISAVTFLSHETSITADTFISNVAICTLISSFIDVDHVFMAGSLYIKDMTNLSQRGLLHCTTFWLLLSTPLFIYSIIIRRIKLQLFTWMVVLAYTSHHLRDGNRRGLWIYPWGSTKPLSKLWYVALSAILPHVFAVLYKIMKPKFSYSSLGDFEIV